MKRIRFTYKELDLITDMIAIADASIWGEGDYQEWDENKTAPVFHSLNCKVAELSRRLENKNK